MKEYEGKPLPGFEPRNSNTPDVAGGVVLILILLAISIVPVVFIIGGLWMIGAPLWIAVIAYFALFR